MVSAPDSQPLHPCDLQLEDLLAQCQVTRTRGSGPGGQHRNKVETAIVIKHEPSGVSGQASEKRSQNANKDAAIGRLRINLALAIRTQRQSCSPRWKARTRQGKLKVNAQHFDYAPILAEALDFVWDGQFDVAATAKRVGTSPLNWLSFSKPAPLPSRQSTENEVNLASHP